MAEEQTIAALAEKRASAYAPRPKHPPVLMGMIAGLVAYLMVHIFALAASLRASDFSTAHLITVAIAFGAAYAFVWNRARAHSKAVQEEIHRLEADQDA